MLFLKQWNYPWITFPACTVQTNQSHMTGTMEQQWELRTLCLCLCWWFKKSFTFRIKSAVKSPFSLLFCHQCQLITIKQLDLNVCLQLHVCDRDIMMVTAARWWAERDRLACLWSVAVLLEEKMTTIVGLKRSINVPLVYHPAGEYITMFKETQQSDQTEQHLLSMMRTNLLPPLQTRSLSEMKGKLCYCNSSKWPAPAALHAAAAIDLYSR